MQRTTYQSSVCICDGRTVIRRHSKKLNLLRFRKGRKLCIAMIAYLLNGQTHIRRIRRGRKIRMKRRMERRKSSWVRRRRRQKKDEEK